jgi:hypothetical protein
LNTTWGSFETFWIPDGYQLSNVWRRTRDFAALLRSGIARKIDYGAGLLDCHAVKYKGGHTQPAKRSFYGLCMFMALAGCSNMATTQRYIDLRPTMIKAAFQLV